VEEEKKHNEKRRKTRKRVNERRITKWTQAIMTH